MLAGLKGKSGSSRAASASATSAPVRAAASPAAPPTTPTTTASESIHARTSAAVAPTARKRAISARRSVTSTRNVYAMFDAETTRMTAAMRESRPVTPAMSTLTSRARVSRGTRPSRAPSAITALTAPGDLVLHDDARVAVRGGVAARARGSTGARPRAAG